MIGYSLDDPWADHPVVNRHICYGGGGGDQAPEVPDYSAYISSMTGIGNKLTGYGDDLMKWAKEQGINLQGYADTVSGRGGELADQGAQTYQEQMAKWKGTYGDLYDAQAADAKRMIKELPNTEEQYAGKYSADVAQAFDASREAQQRALQSYGLKAPGSGGAALDATVRNQRGLGQVAAAEQGRMAARNEARSVTSNALQQGLALPGVANQGSALGLAGGNQQLGAQTTAASTAAGLNSPGLQAFQTATPYMKAWDDTMSNSYNQQLAKFNAQQQADAAGGGGMGGMLGGLAGTVAGSFLGPIGGAVGGKIGGMLGNSIGGSGTSFAEGGPVDGDQMVDPSMSGSQGAITDDVPARLNVGEFVLPKDVVAWLGEEKIQKLVAKARQDREGNTVAEPEMAPTSAIDMQAPTFQSGEAPL